MAYPPAYHIRCKKLLQRIQAYRKFSGATYKAMARASGCHEVRMSSFASLNVATIPEGDLEKLEAFLTERGF